jgi:hypothetical protein
MLQFGAAPTTKMAGVATVSPSADGRAVGCSWNHKPTLPAGASGHPHAVGVATKTGFS